MLLEIPPQVRYWRSLDTQVGAGLCSVNSSESEVSTSSSGYRERWCRGYHVDTVGRNKAKIAEYIRHQLAEDKLGEQLSIPYTGSPFTGRR